MKVKKISYRGKDKNILKVLSEECPSFGYSFLRKILRKSDVKINSKRIKTDEIVKDGDIVEFYYSENNKKPEIIYEDENLIAFYKPKKIPSQGENSFEELVKEECGKNLILCHRLDTNTDGLIFFAKNERVFDEIKRLFSIGAIEKHYLAEIYGIINKKGEYKDYLFKDSVKGRVFLSDKKEKGYKEAILFFSPIAVREKTTLLDVTLVTGRTHQIRAQLAYHGYPIVGDGKYGKESINNEFGKRTQQLTAYKTIFHVSDGFLQYLDGKEIRIKKDFF